MEVLGVVKVVEEEVTTEVGNVGADEDGAIGVRLEKRDRGAGVGAGTTTTSDLLVETACFSSISSSSSSFLTSFT